MDSVISTIKPFVASMLEYQKAHNITAECVTNTQMLYSAMKASGMDVKAKAVIVAINHSETEIELCGAHMVVVTGNKIVESSYEYHQLTRTYFKDIKTFLSEVPQVLKLKDQYKEVISDYLTFVKMEERINSGLFTVASHSYYNKLFKYIKKNNNSVRTISIL